jgi:hypothetical protein
MLWSSAFIDVVCFTIEKLENIGNMKKNTMKDWKNSLGIRLID